MPSFVLVVSKLHKNLCYRNTIMYLVGMRNTSNTCKIENLILFSQTL